MNMASKLLNSEYTLSVNRPLAHAIGFHSALVYAALLAKWCYFNRCNKLEDGWFYAAISDLEERTTLSEYLQKRCITALVKLGLIECENRGMPAKRYFRIIEDVDLLQKLITKGNEISDGLKSNAAVKYNEKKNKQSAKKSDESKIVEKSVENSDCSSKNNYQAPKKTSSLLQRNCKPIPQKTKELLYKTKDNKSKVNNPSINQSKDLMDRMTERTNSSQLNFGKTEKSMFGFRCQDCKS